MPVSTTPPSTVARLVAALALGAILAGACGSRQVPIAPGQSATTTASPTAGVATEATLRTRAAEAIAALAAKDFLKLSILASPDQGVRFSPYAFVDLQRDVVLPVATLAQGFGNAQRHLWGHTDGRGLPMEWTLEDYYTRHLWKKDFSKAPSVVIDQRTGKSNTIDNSAQAYPGARIVEYHQPSTDPNTALDWGSLRLVFEQQGGSWYLVGVIHDEWTI